MSCYHLKQNTKITILIYNIYFLIDVSNFVVVAMEKCDACDDDTLSNVVAYNTSVLTLDELLPPKAKHKDNNYTIFNF